MSIPKGANFPLSAVPDTVEIEFQSFVAEDGGISRGLLYRPRGKRPRVGVHLLHPRTDQTQNYNILPLVQAGYAVLGRSGRWVNNDINTIHERLLLDLAAGIRGLKAAGCEAVILLGNSGGGPLSTLYQAQARKSAEDRYKTTPAGDAFDLGRFDLPLADGLILIGTHLGPGHSLAKWLDASVTDESDPFSIDPELDMYSPDNGFRPLPDISRYSADFLSRWRPAQKLRAQRLDAIARQRIAQRREAAQQSEALAQKGKMAESLAAKRRSVFTNYMPLWRAWADPAWVDLTIEPDDRDICAFNNDPRPDLRNFDTFQSPFISPEAYLSTWSGLSSRALTAERLREIPDPVIIVHYAGDGTTQVAEARQMFDNSAASDKSFELIRNTDHYSFKITGPQQRDPVRSTEGCEAVVAWMEKRFPVTH